MNGSEVTVSVPEGALERGLMMTATRGDGLLPGAASAAVELGPHGTRARFSLAHATFGADILPDLRVGPDGKLYQLATSPSTGVEIRRFSLK